MKIHDITIPLSADLPVWPGDPPVRVEPVATIAGGDQANVSRLTLSTHSGTHLDVPRHFRDDGITVDQVPPELLVGRCRVLEIRGERAIGRRELMRLPVRGEERVLFKTDNSLLWGHRGFQEDFVHLAEDGARYLIEAGVKLVGIDYLSIERFGGGGELHRLLLDAGILILEGITLDGVEPGPYELICLPLRIEGGDGAPARVLLRSRVPAAGEPPFDPHTSRWPLS